MRTTSIAALLVGAAEGVAAPVAAVAKSRVLLAAAVRADGEEQKVWRL